MDRITKGENMQEVTRIHPPHQPRVGPSDDKYLVLRRDELDDLLVQLLGGEEPPTWVKGEVEGYAIEDAVVIRTQDVFAGPALHHYATTIRLVARYLADTNTRHTLEEVGDYFAGRAFEADVVHDAGDSKLPGVK